MGQPIRDPMGVIFSFKHIIQSYDKEIILGDEV